MLKNTLVFFAGVFFYYLCRLFVGCLNIRAEIIPFEPDADNAAVGKRVKINLT